MNVTKNTETKVIVTGVTIDLSIEEATNLRVFLGSLGQGDVDKLLKTYSADSVKVFDMTYNLYCKLNSVLQ